MFQFLRSCSLALALSMAPSVAGAAAYDPALTWRSMTTDHFRITFHGGEEKLAEQSAAILEQAWDELTAELKTAPRRRVEVVLVDRTDAANGYAQTVPVNTIVIYVTAPTEDSTLSSYENWNETILTHELVHILHIDTVEGLPGAVRAVLGRVISVNRISPGWMIEGFATFEETRHTTAGRGRSTTAHMIKRMAALEDGFPPLGNMDGWTREPPAGNLRYLFGQDFIDYVAQTRGENVWTDWVHGYGRGIPYLLPGKRIFGRRLLPMYKEWKEDFLARYQRQADEVRAQGLTEPRYLTEEGLRCSTPTWSPDGSRLVYSCTDPRRGPAIWLAERDGGGAEIELDGRSASTFTWRPDSKGFAFSSSRVVNRFNVWNDISLYTIGGSVESMTRGQRARDPEFSPDGQVMLTVTNAVQNNQLARLTVDRRLDTLTEHDDSTQLSTPRFSPDGRYLALSIWRDGRRDLWLYTAAGEPWRPVTMDLAHDMDPAWSPDGRTLYFSSDRTGIFNVYAVDLDSERLYQVTNVLGGAFSPSPHPDGAALTFESFHHLGSRIAWLELDRDRWTDRGTLPRPLEGGPPLRDAQPAEGDVQVAARAYRAQKAREAWEAERAAEAPPTLAPTEGPTGGPTESPTESPPPPPVEEEPWKVEEAGRPRADRGRRATGVAGVAMFERMPYPGLDGFGGPFQHARRWPGTWGLPEEGAPPGSPGQAADDIHGKQGDDGPWGDAPDAGTDEQRATVVELEGPEEEEFPFSWPVGRYSPWGSLLPPRYLLPTITSTTFGFQGMLSTSGADTLRRWLYGGYLSYRTDASYLGWGASLAWNRYVPIVTAGAYAYAVPYGDLYVQPDAPGQGGGFVPGVESSNERYWDERIRAYAQVTHPIDEYRSIFGRWSGTVRRPLDPLPEDAYRPFLPTRGFISSVGGGWRYARGKAYEYSIAPEQGRILSLVGDLSVPWIGAFVLDDQDQRVGFTQLQVTAEWREYHSLPWATNHVLATKLAGGFSTGDENRYGSYRLGGSFGESAYYTLPDEWRALRGFPAAVVYGDSYYLGSAEYRLPLWYIDRGVGTVPFFARGIHAAAFVDAGNAFTEVTAETISGLRVGTGAELTGSAILGWGIPVTVRLGYAFAAVGDGGYAPGSLGGAYVWFGSSF